MDVVVAWLPRLASAAALTLVVSAVICTLSGLSGLTMALAGYGRQRGALTYSVDAFSALFRSIPELVILFLFYFGAATLGLDLGPIGSAIVAFWLVGAAYDYQVFRGALSAIPEGQMDAARSLGLRRFASFRLVILPQLVPLAKAGWITYAIGTVKRLSIASAISVTELLYVTKQAIAATNRPFVFLGVAGVFYLVIVLPLLVWNERSEAAR
jgi:His/Glu/Gln/Arg/opine family amino acid ABC transporter permease subunit